MTADVLNHSKDETVFDCSKSSINNNISSSSICSKTNYEIKNKKRVTFVDEGVHRSRQSEIIYFFVEDSNQKEKEETQDLYPLNTIGKLENVNNNNAFFSQHKKITDPSVNRNESMKKIKINLLQSAKNTLNEHKDSIKCYFKTSIIYLKKLILRNSHMKNISFSPGATITLNNSNNRRKIGKNNSKKIFKKRSSSNSKEKNKSSSNSREEKKSSSNSIENKSSSNNSENKSSNNSCKENKSSNNSCEENKSSNNSCEENKSSNNSCEENKSSNNSCKENKSSSNSIENKSSSNSSEEKKSSSITHQKNSDNNRTSKFSDFNRSYNFNVTQCGKTNNERCFKAMNGNECTNEKEKKIKTNILLKDNLSNLKKSISTTRNECNFTYKNYNICKNSDVVINKNEKAGISFIESRIKQINNASAPYVEIRNRSINKFVLTDGRNSLNSHTTNRGFIVDSSVYWNDYKTMVDSVDKENTNAHCSSNNANKHNCSNDTADASNRHNSNNFKYCVNSEKSKIKDKDDESSIRRHEENDDVDGSSSRNNCSNSYNTHSAMYEQHKSSAFKISFSSKVNSFSYLPEKYNNILHSYLLKKFAGKKNFCEQQKIDNTKEGKPYNLNCYVSKEKSDTHFKKALPDTLKNKDKMLLNYKLENNSNEKLSSNNNAPCVAPATSNHYLITCSKSSIINNNINTQIKPLFISTKIPATNPFDL